MWKIWSNCYILNFHERITVTLDKVSLDKELMSAAFYDFSVSAEKLPCQALRLIDKLVTGSL